MTNRLMLSMFILAISTIANAQFISVKDANFNLNNRPYYFVGTNYWYGSLLGLEQDKRRGVDRLRKELDFLRSNGVTNLRLMAGAEGSGAINGVTRVGPPLQPELGKFDARVLDGLDLILDEMSKRDMKAVIFLSNNWEWSGGFQQYVDWNGVVPDELKGRKLNWDETRDMVGRFYLCAECRVQYRNQVRYVLNRRNKITGLRYVDDPTIMAWELANEPRPMWPQLADRYVEWINEAASEIKSIDKNHLVTIGHEGWIGTQSMQLYEKVHADPNVDYLTIHIWPKNWEWFRAEKLSEDFTRVLDTTVEYINDHIAAAKRLNKPLVIEEFGLPRDGRRRPQSRLSTCLSSRTQRLFDPCSATSLRDKYYQRVLSFIGGPIAGANFWAFGGIARPADGQIFWKTGDQFMGDPPMEEQGLNSVFDTDRSTWRVINAASRGFNR